MVDGAIPPIVSIVAKSNTGKTSLIEGLIPILEAHGLRVGVIKHHSHPGTFDTAGKDTHRLAEAGAEVVVGLGPHQVAVFSRPRRPPEIEAVVEAHLRDLDLVLTEGFRRGPYPKIEVNRMARSGDLVCEPEELLALMTDGQWDIGVPTFRLEDVESLARLLIDRLNVAGFSAREWVRTSAVGRRRDDI